MSRVRLLLADDHDIVIEGLRRVLDHPKLEIAGVVHDGRSLVRSFEEIQPDITIADITMPQLNGLEAARQIRKKNGKAKIIFLTMHPEVAFARAALASGVSGYVLKNTASDELLPAIWELMDGRIYVSGAIRDHVMRALSNHASAWRSPVDKLTPRQREVLQLLAEGHHVKEVAARLHLSPRTVEFHKYRIMEDLGLRTTAELARYASRHGIVA